MIEYHTAIQPHLAPMFHLHHHSADLQLNTLKRSTELGEASHRSISSGRAGKRMQRSIPRGMRIQKKKASDSLLNRRLFKKTAATYSPTVTQYHRRDEA